MSDRHNLRIGSLEWALDNATFVREARARIMPLTDDTDRKDIERLFDALDELWDTIVGDLAEGGAVV